MDILFSPRKFLGPHVGGLLLLPIVAHVRASPRKKLFAARSVTLSAVIPAILLVLSDRKKPSLALRATADAMDYGKILDQEGNGNDLRVSAATR
jgi:hypothetical protein